MKPEDKAKVDAALLAYYEANKAKNAGQTAETKANKQVEVLLKDEKSYTYAVNNSLNLVAGITTETKFEIDPKKVLELYPDQFWEIVSIAMGTAKEVLGEKGATKCTVPRTETKFRIKKDKV